MSVYLDKLLADAHEELFNGVAVGAVVGASAVYIAQRDRSSAGVITAATVGCMAIASASQVKNDDLIRFKVSGGNTATAAIGTAAVTFGMGVIADLIWGEDVL